MGRPRTGQARFRNGRWTARVTVGAERPTYTLSAFSRLEDEVEARERALVLADAAARLTAAGALDLAPRLLERAASVSAAELPRVLDLVAAVTAGKYVAEGSREGMTFAELARKWTSGELARDYPDHVKKKRSGGDDGGRLKKHILPLVGDVPLERFTLDHAERVMGAIGAEAAPATRRHIAQLMNRLLGLAVFPMRVIKVNPLPRGWVPSGKSHKAKSYLYPEEDALLLAAPSCALRFRMLYGWLAREGTRAGEALALQRRDVDLEHGVVHLDENKTDDPRSWALGSDVALALELYFELRGEVRPEDPVFPLNVVHANRFREHLAAAGVGRAKLFEKSEKRRPIRIHDLRGTFVTLALANGRTETWVADRTGHKSSQMINEYRRAARTAAEVGQPWLAPMHEAIPELKRRHKGADPSGAPGEAGEFPSDDGEFRRVDSNHDWRIQSPQSCP